MNALSLLRLDSMIVLRRPALTALTFVCALTLGCAGGPAPSAPTGPLPPERQPIPVEAMAKAFTVEGVEDPAGWAADLGAALAELGHPPTLETACGVAAVVERESGFKANRPVEGFSAQVDRWVSEATFRYEPRGSGPFADALKQVLDTAAPGQTRSFRQRLAASRDEATVYKIYAELVQTFEYSWPRAFETVNFAGGLDDIDPFDFDPLTTAGCMGAPVEFVLDEAREARVKAPAAMAAVYTRAGCLKAGAAKLLGDGGRYEDPLYRFADYHGETFASRNAAFQERVVKLTGRALTFDGRLLFYEGDGSISLRPSPTFLALLALRDRYGIALGESKMMRDLAQEKSTKLEETVTWAQVERTYLSNTGLKVEYARLPDLSFRALGGEDRTSAWFAAEVMKGYRTCLLRMN